MGVCVCVPMGYACEHDCVPFPGDISHTSITITVSPFQNTLITLAHFTYSFPYSPQLYLEDLSSDFLGWAWCGDEGSKPLTSYLESQDWSSGSNLKVALAYPPVPVPQPGRHDVPWVLASKGPSASVHTAKYLDSMMVPDRTQHDTVASMDTEARASLEAHLKDYRLVPGVKCTEKSHILMLKPTWLESVWTRGGQNRATSVIAGLSVYTRPAKGRKASWRELTVLSDFPKPQEGSNSLSTHSNTTGQ